MMKNLKDYTLSEVREICSKNILCSECMLGKSSGGCVLEDCPPNRWELSKITRRWTRMDEDDAKALIHVFGKAKIERIKNTEKVFVKVHYHGGLWTRVSQHLVPSLTPEMGKVDITKIKAGELIE